MRRRTSTLRPLLCAGLLSLTLLLAGCAQADPQPKFEKPAASPTVAKEETAEEFIERWNDEQNKMISGDAAAWREMTPDCRGCQTTADEVESYYAAGGGVQTAGREIRSVRPLGKTDGSHRFRVDIDSAPTRYRRSSDAPEESFPGGLSKYEVTLTKSATGWEFVDYFEVSR